ncbi:MAG: hypothetical protein HYS58_03995 [Elusimicrobia bacterium]|nr:hypothetical protein [Elusimicrobiota bacterium]
MDTFLQVLAVVGIIETIILIVGLVWAFSLWVRGISPALFRLGNGLAKRKIALFAKGDNLASLKHLLVDSKLFNEKNIYEISKTEDIGRAECTTMYLVVWHDWVQDMAEILRQKPDQCALIVYAPYDRGRIPDDQMKALDGKRHTAVTNFRGRLLNDIVASMITTSYEY